MNVIFPLFLESKAAQFCPENEYHFSIQLLNLARK